MRNGNKHTYFFWFSVFVVGVILNGCALSQVTNNSGSPIHRARINPVNFSENLDYCGTGCSTGFKRVPRGENRIYVQPTSESSFVPMGSLGPFKKRKYYSVNIRMIRKRYCAELWKRGDTDSEFNHDTTKRLIKTRCPEVSSTGHTGPRPISQVTNNAGTLLFRVKIGGVQFSENLSFCGTGCSTGFLVVGTGENVIELKETSSSEWRTLADPLDPFEHGGMYSVNIIRNAGGNFCAELWKRGNSGMEFNNDPTKQYLESHCFE